MREFAYPLPMRIVAALLDVRDDQIDMLKAWSDDFISVQAGNIPDDRVVVAARHTIEFEKFILAKLEERRREKRDDLLGRLIDVPEGEEPLTVQELLNFALQILVGGNESTTNFLGNGLYQLLTTPGLIAEIQKDPKRIPDIVEEILRHDAPLQGLFRVALEDHDFDGRDSAERREAHAQLRLGKSRREILRRRRFRPRSRQPLYLAPCLRPRHPCLRGPGLRPAGGSYRLRDADAAAARYPPFGDAAVGATDAIQPARHEMPTRGIRAEPN